MTTTLDDQSLSETPALRLGELFWKSRSQTISSVGSRIETNILAGGVTKVTRVCEDVDWGIPSGCPLLASGSNMQSHSSETKRVQ